MSRRRSARRPSAPPPAPRRHVARTALLVVASVAIAAVSLWAASRWRRPVTAPPRETLPVATLIDSVKATDRAQDRAGLCYWLQRLRATSPRDPRYQLALAMAWHNLAWVGVPYGRERSATRTSLERVTMEKRVLALMDSATVDARTPAEWARAQYWSGVVRENLGLTTDALRIYTGAHLRAPGATPALTHAAALMKYLSDPRPPAAPSAAPGAMEQVQP
jgi:hypothetical protein